MTILLEKGKNINERNKDGFSPLQLAADKDKRDAVKLLLDKGAEANAPWPKHKWF